MAKYVQSFAQKIRDSAASSLSSTEDRGLVTTDVFLETLHILQASALPNETIHLADHLRAEGYTVDQRTHRLLLKDLRLENVSLENINLGLCDFTGSVFNEVSFGGAARTTFWQSDLTSVIFRNTKNTGTIDARQTILKHTRFEKADLGRFYVSGAEIEDITLSDDTTLTNVTREDTAILSGAGAKEDIITRSERSSHFQDQVSSRYYDIPAALKPGSKGAKSAGSHIPGV